MQKFPAFLLGLLLCVCNLSGQIILSRHQKTDYGIVSSSALTDNEKTAVAELAQYLNRITGASFAVTEATDRPQNAAGPSIFVGWKAPSDTAPLKPYERRIKSEGKDIFLCGADKDGNAFAIFDFLDTFLGCRFFTFRGAERIPQQDSPSWPKLDFSIVPSFPAPYLFSGTWAINTEQLLAYSRRSRMFIQEAGVTIIGPDYLHVPGKLIPPGTEYKKQAGIWKPYRISQNDAYFGSHPEYYAMNEKGVRVPDKQLCYSNPEARALLESKLEQIIREEYQGGTAYLICDLNDSNGFNGKTICCCPGCMELVEKYQSPAGPYWHFLFDLCERFQTEHPDIVLVTTAYLSTEKPPEGVAEMPKNLLVTFCPLNKDFSKPYDAPSNARVMRRFQQWQALHTQMRLWLYPSIYARVTTILPLVANLRQLAQNLRIAKQYGVVSIEGEQGEPWHNVNGFNEIRQYMLGKLMNDVTLDENTLIEEAMNGIYGAAAPKMIAFWHELEALEAAEPAGLMWHGCGFGVFRYLTTENLLRWSHDFDEMERLVDDDPVSLNYVRDARVFLDENILSVNFRLPKLSEFNPEVLAARVRREIQRAIDDAPHREKVKDWQKFRQGILDLRCRNGVDYFAALARPPKPLPEPFNEATAHRALPTRMLNSQTLRLPHLTPDADAAFGVAMKCSIQNLERARFTTMVYFEPSSEKFHGILNHRHEVARKKLQEHIGEFRFYWIGSTRLWPQSYLSLSHLDLGGIVPLGQFFNPESPDTVYDLHVSLKLDDEGFLWIDQVVLTPSTAPLQPQEVRSMEQAG